MKLGECRRGVSETGSRSRFNGASSGCATVPWVLSMLIVGSSFAQASGESLVAGSVSAGGSHACAVLDSGQAVCWGNNRYGQIGNGNRKRQRTPAVVKGLSDVVEISAGDSHTCAVLSSGKALCWGWNDAGQLGVGDSKDRLIPSPVKGLTDAKSISSGKTHSCAIRQTGQAVCWGNIYYGGLGDGTKKGSRRPVAVKGLAKTNALSAGDEVTCAIRSSGRAVCWGRGDEFQIGDGSVKRRLRPVPVSGIGDVKSISTADSYACAAEVSGQVSCWGKSTMGFHRTPKAVSGLSDATEVDTSGHHVCAVKESGQVVCWGGNSYGELGDGTGGSSYYAPVQTTGLTDATEVATGGGGNEGDPFSCAVNITREVVCWGSNKLGQLGNSGFKTGFEPGPVVLQPPPPVEEDPLLASECSKAGMAAPVTLRLVLARIEVPAHEVAFASGNVFYKLPEMPTDCAGKYRRIVDVNIRYKATKGPTRNLIYRDSYSNKPSKWWPVCSGNECSNSKLAQSRHVEESVWHRQFGRLTRVVASGRIRVQETSTKKILKTRRLNVPARFSN